MTNARNKSGRAQAGATLVELVIFIVVVSIAATGVLMAFSAVQRGAPSPRQLTLATQLAQERMELILAQKSVLGFACFTSPRFDPCQAAAAGGACAATIASVQPQCTPTANYTVTPSLAPDWNGDANYKVVSVVVNGPEGLDLARLDAIVANY